MEKESIHIGFDAKRLFHNNTGLGNYSRTLVKNLNSFSSLDISLFSPNIDKEMKRKWAAFHIHTGKGILYRSFGIQKDISNAGISIYHGLSQELPRVLDENVKYIVTIHDMMPFVRPQDFSVFNRKVYQNKVKHACTHANVIVAISESTKEDILEYLDVPEHKIKVRYQALSQMYQNTDLNSLEIPERFNLTSPYMLSVGTIQNRKNQGIILDALHNTTREMPLLVFVSARTRRMKNMEKHVMSMGLQDKVVFLSDVTHEELPPLYANALFTIYPSLYEGFGLPVAESLACGTPVITTSHSSLPEAGGPGAMYADNSEDLLAAMITLTNDHDKRKKLARDGRLYVHELFSEKRTTQRILEVYQRLIMS